MAIKYWNGAEWLDLASGATGPQGPAGNGISSVVLNSDYTLTINYTNGASTTVGPIRGEQGKQGEQGNGVASVTLISTVGKAKTYRMLFTDGTYTDYVVMDGADGGTGTLTQITFDGTVYTDDGSGNVTLSESDPVFVASDAYSITSTDITNWNNKGTYSKPSGGIPKTDLASAVQTSLGKADTALQSYTETDPVFTASAAHGITSSDITAWNNKSNFSGSYNDLTNVPASFTPSAHSHNLADVTDVTASASEVNILDGATIPTADLNQAYQGIPYGNVTSNSTTVFTATVPGVTTLKDGTCCLIRNNNKQTSASGWTLNVNDLGAKPVYNNMADATRDTTIFNKVYTMLFVYDEDRVSGGCWICYRGYNSDNNTIGYQLRTNSTVMNVSDTARYYKLYFMSADNTMWVPASVNSTNNATAARAVNQRPINPFGRIVYTSASTNYTAGSNLAAATIWDQYALSLGYSFNRTGAALTMTVEAPVYVKCAPQADGSAIMDADTPIVQALPSTADGKIYIYLGVAYSAVNIELVPHHPVYYHDGTAIRLWTGASGGSSSVAWNDITGKPTFATVATSGDYDDLLNKPAIPTVPTNVSAFTNDAGYLTSYTETDPVFTASAAHGITSTDITNWNSKQASISGAASTITSSNLTASRALVSDSSGKVAASSVTSTELGYLSGTASAVQTQLNGKINEPATEGTNGQILTTNGNGGRTWTTVSAASDAQVTTAVNTWLGANVAQETGYVLDRTLSMSNAAAPADLAGGLKSALNDITKEEIIGTGYGINTKENGIGTANISGNVLQNAYIRKCGKNLFDKEDCDSTTDFVANSTKYYQPFVPIYLVPGKTYKVTFIVKDRETYNATTWSNKQWVSNDPNTIRGINSSEFANIDTKTVSFTVGDSGCLYFVNVWGEQSMLDKFFACFNVVVVETGIYDDETSYVEYNGTDVSFSTIVDASGYENVIIHRNKNDADLLNALPEADIVWTLYSANADDDIERAEKRANAYADYVSAKCKLIPLFVDPIAGFNWVSTYEISAFSSNNPAYTDGTTDGNNGYFAITGNSGDNYVTVISGGNADTSVLTNAEKARWLGGVIIDDDGNATPCNFFYKSSTEFYVYPALTRNISNGQLAGIQTGMHLSKRGYKGYAQSLWNINPKHCEKSKYIKKYRPGDEIPFVVYGGKVGASTDTRNVPVQYQNKYGATTYVLNMDWGSAQFHNTETGIEWTLNIGGKNGYVEAYVGDSGKGVTTSTIDSAGASYSFEYAEGAEIHCDLYVDGVLADSYLKKSKRLERVCLDYGNGQTATLKVYSNKWQETGHGFSVGAITWWVNERWTDSAENPYLFKAITQLFDSWGDFQNQEVQRELEDLHKNAIGTPVPINNKSMRNMTSQWGRLWFYENVQQENATIMLSDFGINDYNSSITTFPDEVAPDGSAWPVNFTISSYADSIGKLNEMAVKNNIQPITIGLGYRNAGAIIWMQSAIDAQSTKVN